VYSVSADGLGAQSVLPSLDSVSKQLRGKLGEALAMVSKQSQPLAQVATPDLNALKAYSLGESAYDHVDLKSAEALFTEALRIDPHFALARVGLARVFVGEDQPTKVLQEIRAAQADHARLSSREALYVDAWAANFTQPRQALEKWKLLASVYPDYFPGLSAYAYFLWSNSNDFKAAIPYLEQAATSKNPHRAIGEYILGALYVEAERYPDALRAFSKSIADGLRLQRTYYASAYAAQRKFSDAMATMTHGKPASGTAASSDIVDANLRVAIALDQGKWAQANELRNRVQAQVKALEPRFAARYEITDLSLRALDGTPVKRQIAALTNYIADQRKAMVSAGLAERTELKFQLALAGYLSARAGDVELAKRALAAAGAEPSDIPLLDNLRGVAEAEVERASDRPQSAVAILKPLVNGSELYVTHVALMDAYADTHESAKALEEARWLSSHRGRAYLENSVQQLLTPFNVAESDIALLNAAEFSLALGDKTDARKSLDAFRHAWPGMMQTGFWAERFQKVEGKL